MGWNCKATIEIELPVWKALHMAECQKKSGHKGWHMTEGSQDEYDAAGQRRRVKYKLLWQPIDEAEIVPNPWEEPKKVTAVITHPEATNDEIPEILYGPLLTERESGKSQMRYLSVREPGKVVLPVALDHHERLHQSIAAAVTQAIQLPILPEEYESVGERIMLSNVPPSSLLPRLLADPPKWEEEQS